MKLIMTLLIRDNADTLRENLEYHFKQGVDFVIATDNLSVDDSKSILMEYQRQGRLHYIYEPSDTFNQAKWVTRMARMASWRFGADWVINNDADEFWWPKKGQTLKALFLNLPKGINVVEAYRNNFLYCSDEPEELPFYRRMTYRELCSSNAMGERLPSKLAHIARPWAKVGFGNHSVWRIGRVKRVCDLIEIFHYPIRSRAQIIEKISKGGSALQRQDKLNDGVATTWKALYRELKQHGSIDTYIAENSYTQSDLGAGVSDGTLCKDLRLHDYLTELNDY